MLKSMGRALAGCFWGIDLLFNKLLGTSVSRRWCGVDPTAKPCWWQGSAPASPVPQSCSGEKSSPSIPLCRCTEHFLPAAAVRLFKFLKHCLTSAFLACNPDLISKGEHKGRRLTQRLLSPADGELRISPFTPLLLPKNRSGGQRELWPRGKALSGGPGDAGSAVLYLTRDDSLVLAVSFCPVKCGCLVSSVLVPELYFYGFILWVRASSCVTGFNLGCCLLVLPQCK